MRVCSVCIYINGAVNKRFDTFTDFTLSPQYMQLTYVPDEPQLFVLREKSEDPQIEPHAQDLPPLSVTVELLTAAKKPR